SAAPRKHRHVIVLRDIAETVPPIWGRRRSRPPVRRIRGNERKRLPRSLCLAPQFGPLAAARLFGQDVRWNNSRAKLRQRAGPTQSYGECGFGSSLTPAVRDA